MLTQFESFISNQIPLTSDERTLFRKVAIERTLLKKEVLLHEGEVCRYKVFIMKGLMRAYRTTDDGTEHILQFSPELTWITDGESYEHLTPASITIDALENSDVLLWPRDEFHQLMKQIPQLKIYSDRLISKKLYSSQQRIFTGISTTAEERYESFIQENPGIFARVPLHMVASYLGVSRETLSRIRHAQLHDKK